VTAKSPTRQLPQRRYTYADYRNFPAGQRWELIDGEAICMSPAPTPLHQRIVLTIASQLQGQLRGKHCEAFVAPLDVVLPDHEPAANEEADDDATTVVQPDVMVFCDPAQVGPKHARGAPTLVVEVLSRGTAGYDQIKKRRKYEQAGVQELWLVDPEEGVLYINRRDATGVFVGEAPAEMVGQTAIACLEGVAVDWEPLKPWLPVIEP